MCPWLPTSLQNAEATDDGQGKGGSNPLCGYSGFAPFRICTATRVGVTYAVSATPPTGWWQYAFCTFASRVAKSGGSRWQPSATMYFFLFVAHPCGGSVATTRVAVVLRRVPRLFLYLFFSFCTARSSLASVPLAGSLPLRLRLAFLKTLNQR